MRLRLSGLRNFQAALRYDEHGDIGAPQYGFSDATQKQATQTGAAVAAHHDQIATMFLCDLQDRIDRLTFCDFGLRLHTFSSQAGSRFQNDRFGLVVHGLQPTAYEIRRGKTQRGGLSDIDDHAHGARRVLLLREHGSDVDSLGGTVGPVDRNDDLLEHMSRVALT